jgi:hypothetical protein
MQWIRDLRVRTEPHALARIRGGAAHEPLHIRAGDLKEWLVRDEDFGIQRIDRHVHLAGN